MTQLDANISSSDTVLVVDTGSEQDNGFRFRIDDEIMTFLGYDRDSTADIVSYLAGDRTRWRVARGQDGTEAASHLAGADLFAVAAAFATGTDLVPPDPFAEVVNVTPTLAAVLAEGGPAVIVPIQTIDLSDTDATEAQFSPVLDTRGGKSLGLLTNVADNPLNVMALSRFADTPWALLTAIETGVIGAGFDGGDAQFSIPTSWPPNGISTNGGPLPSHYMDTWAGLFDESVIVCQPVGTQAASVTTAMGSTTPAIPGSNEIYSIDVTTSQTTSGTFKVTYDGQTTAALAYNIGQAAFIAALEALSSIGAGNVQTPVGHEDDSLAVSGELQLEFIGALGGQALPAPTITDNTTDQALTVSEAQLGGEGGSPEEFVPTPDADLVFSIFANAPGHWGYAFSVRFVDPGEPDHPLEFRSDDGYRFEIVCETDSGGAIVTVALDITSVLTAAAQAPSPWAILAELAEGSDGGGLVNATDDLPLTGGDAGDPVTYRVRGSV